VTEANEAHQLARRFGNNVFRMASGAGPVLFSTFASSKRFNGNRDLAAFCETGGRAGEIFGIVTPEELNQALT
jgi:hypothetical protein